MLPAADLVQNLGRVERGGRPRQYASQRDPLNPLRAVQSRLTTTCTRDGPTMRSRQCGDRWRLSPRPDVAALRHRPGAAARSATRPGRSRNSSSSRPGVEADRICRWRYHAVGRKAESDAALAKLIRQAEKHTPRSTSRTCSRFAARRIAPSSGSTRPSPITTRASRPRSPSIPDVQPPFATTRGGCPSCASMGKSPEQLAAIKFEVTPPKEGS